MRHCISKTRLWFVLNTVVNIEGRETRPVLPSPWAVSLHGGLLLVSGVWFWLYHSGQLCPSICCRDVFPSYLNKSSVSEKAKSPLWLNTVQFPFAWWLLWALLGASFVLHGRCCHLVSFPQFCDTTLCVRSTPWPGAWLAPVGGS